jgi:hypothetical protein
VEVVPGASVPILPTTRKAALGVLVLLKGEVKQRGLVRITDKINVSALAAVSTARSA